MDMKKMFTDEEHIPPHLLAMVERSSLKAELCELCAHLVQQFSRLHQQMEKIQMEMNSSLSLIRGKFLEEDKTNNTEDADLLEKNNILNAPRKEAISKCSLKLLNSQPRVKIENLSTKKALSGQLQSNGLSSTSIMPQQSILPNSNQEEATETEIDIELVKVERHLSDSTSSVSDLETASDMSKSTHSNHVCAMCGKEFANMTYLKAHQKRVHTYRKFRCQKCNTTFKRNDSLTYHQSHVKDCKARRIIALAMEGGKFTCQLCKNRFVDSSTLARHYGSIHLKLKEHGCNLCKMKFARRDNLRVHMHKFIRRPCNIGKRK